VSARKVGLLLVVVACLLLPYATREAGSEEKPAAPQTGWAGSASCAACHPKINAQWQKTAHANTIRWRKQDEAVDSARPFDGEVFRSRGIAHSLGPGPQMEVEGPGGELRSFPVTGVVGVRRIQMFMTELDRGRLQVLPVYLEVPTRKWFDYADFIFGGPRHFEIPPDSSNSWYGPLRNFNSRCGECHMTGYDVGYDAGRGTYATRWQESVVGCESCHGPAAGHVAKWRKLADGPDPIVNPARLTVERSNQTCGYCHAEREEVAAGFRPGDDLFAFTDVNGLEDQKHLHPDGRARELIHNLVPIMQSRCRPLGCTTCHDPHGSGAPGDLYYPEDPDHSCKNCHEQVTGRLTEHTKHKADSTGSRCVACHMQRLVIEGGHGKVYDHTISIPSPRNTQKHGVPNACRGCHPGEMPGWDAEHFNRLWPGAEERNHRTKLADAVALGRARDPKAPELLKPLLQSDNPVYRAGAAWMLGQFDTDLRPQLNDAHPMVRRAALSAVAPKHPEALEPLLQDPNTVLRRAAALQLALRPSYVGARPELRRRLIPLLEALCRKRPDSRQPYKALGYLFTMEGETQKALEAYERYLRLNPWDGAIRAAASRLK